MKQKSCLTNLISFYDKVTHLADQGKPVNMIFMNFGKAFDTISHSIVAECTLPPLSPSLLQYGKE